MFENLEYPSDCLEERICRRSDHVKRAVTYLKEQGQLMSIDQISESLGLSKHQQIVVRRALIEIAESEKTITHRPLRPNIYGYSPHSCLIKSRIDVAVKLLRLELSDITFRHNERELESLLMEIEKQLNDTLNQFYRTNSIF